MQQTELSKENQRALEGLAAQGLLPLPPASPELKLHKRSIAGINW